jgi:hypothetical protein
VIRLLGERIRSLTAFRKVVLGSVPLMLALGIAALLVGEALGLPRYGATVAVILFSVGMLGALVIAAHAARTVRGMARDHADAALAKGDLGPPRELLDDQLMSLMINPAAEEARWLASLDEVPTRSILAHGLATRSDVALEYFARRATGWRFDAESLREVALGYGDDWDSAARAVGPSHPDALTSLARLLLSYQPSPLDIEFARALRQLAIRQERAPSDISRRNLIQQSLIAGEDECARTVLALGTSGEYPDRFFQLDLLNPHRLSTVNTESERLWMTAVGSIFRRVGLEPIELLSSGSTVFDRLTARANPVEDDGPLVTVIMSCYLPGDGLLTAVRSMVAQTWQNWELLITDDASPHDRGAVLERVQALDPRVRVIRNRHNAGTYVRRNEALAEARGEFVTMHDSDDWAHPRRLEIQVRHLLENPGSIANLSQSMRVSEALQFSQPRGTSIRLTESSLMFRRESTLALVGGFDTVRKAADSEFRMRLEAAVGTPVPLIDLQAPLSLVRFDPGSLSAGDLGDGWMHPARVAYRSAQQAWRRERQRTGGSMRFDREATERPFPAHAHLTGETAKPVLLDVLLMLDPREGIADEGPLEAAASELVRLSTAGLRVGLRRSLAVVPERPRAETCASLQALINAGTVQEVLPTDDVTTRLLVVRQEASLAGISRHDRPVKADLVVIVGGRTSLPGALILRALGHLTPDQSRARSVSATEWSAEVDRLCRAATPGGPAR